MAQFTGQQFGDYRLTDYLGGGGFAEVYLGEHIHLHKKRAAVKVLKGVFTEKEMTAFHHEAQALASLEHPHIIHMITFSIAIIEGQHIPFLVMEYAPHATLAHRHPRGEKLPLPTIVSYVKQIASALDYAHTNNVIHRDIKPANLLVGKNGRVLVSDFGIAVTAQGTGSFKTQNVSGTMAYMAPEQIQGRPCPASDQYALAILVYEWLCGERPFDGTFAELAIKHTLFPPPSLRQKVPDLAPGVEEVVLRALAKNPKQRFSSVKDFALALERAYQADLIHRPTFLVPQNDAESILQHYDKLVHQYWSNRQIDNALDLLDKMMRLAPQDPRAHEKLATICIERGFLDEGIAELHVLVDIYLGRHQTEQASEVLCRIGRIYSSAGNYEDALRYFQRSIELSHYDIDMIRETVMCCLHLSRLQDAIKYQVLVVRRYFEAGKVNELIASLQQLIALDQKHFPQAPLDK